MQGLMLDTNIVSYVVNGVEQVCEKLYQQDACQLFISSITYGEVLYGLAKKPHAKNLHAVTKALLRSLRVLSWDSNTAESYALLRATLTKTGYGLSVMDTLIAAHAMAENITLVTHDEALKQVPGLKWIDWY